MTTEVVSNPVETAGGGTAWVEMNIAEQYAVICDGCGVEQDWRMGLAPALVRLVQHAKVCAVAPAP